jgi:hypothetical protein
MRKLVIALALLLLLVLPAFGYLETRREKILADHLKQVADMAAILQKITEQSTITMSDRAQMRQIANQLQREAQEYQTAAGK